MIIIKYRLYPFTAFTLFPSHISSKYITSRHILQIGGKVEMLYVC